MQLDKILEILGFIFFMLGLASFDNAVSVLIPIGFIFVGMILLSIGFEEGGFREAIDNSDVDELIRRERRKR